MATVHHFNNITQFNSQLKQGYDSDINILYLNARSLKNKIYKIEILAKTMKRTIDVIVVQKHGLKKQRRSTTIFLIMKSCILVGRKEVAAVLFS